MADKEKNEVAVKEETGLSAFSAFAGLQTEDQLGLEVINASDIQLPKYKLLQATSPEVAKSKGTIKPGQFYNTVTEKAVDSLDITLLSLSKSMVMWKKPFKRGEDPLCKSYDGKTKVEGCGDGKCETCQYSSQNQAAWNNLAEGETKPACNMSYVWLAIDNTTGTPFRIILAGSSVATTKTFLNKMLPLRLPAYCIRTTLTSAQEENDFGVFQVAVFGDPRPNGDILNQDGTINEAKRTEYVNKVKSYKDIFESDIVQRDTVYVDHVEDSAPAGEQGKNGTLF